MAYVFKPKYTIPIPANAERIEIKGRACVRWKSRGRTVVGEVCERNPERCRVESGKWWVVAVDQHGQEHKRPGFRDRKSEGCTTERDFLQGFASAGEYTLESRLLQWPQGSPMPARLSPRLSSLVVGLASLAGAAVFAWLLAAGWCDSGALLRAVTVAEYGLPCAVAAALGVAGLVGAVTGRSR